MAILHNCIMCDYFSFKPICDNSPMFEKHFCPECGEEQYIFHSRIDPRTYSKDMVIVDEINKTVVLKEGY